VHLSLYFIIPELYRFFEYTIRSQKEVVDTI
jgi:hypothetical protein